MLFFKIQFLSVHCLNPSNKTLYKRCSHVCVSVTFR